MTSFLQKELWYLYGLQHYYYVNNLIDEMVSARKRINKLEDFLLWEEAKVIGAWLVE